MLRFTRPAEILYTPDWGVSSSQPGPADPVLFAFPEQFESARMLLRAPRWGDGAGVNEAIRESLAELQPWMPWAEHPPSPDETEANLRHSRLRFLERKDMRLILLAKETGQVLGCSGLHQPDWIAGKFEIGYWLRTSASGHGYMTEAVGAITAFAFRELHANRVQIRCDARNERSAKVAERCGFTLEGILRQEERAKDGSLRDTMVFAKVRGAEFN